MAETVIPTLGVGLMNLKETPYAGIERTFSAAEGIGYVARGSFQRQNLNPVVSGVTTELAWFLGGCPAPTPLHRK